MEKNIQPAKTAVLEKEAPVRLEGTVGDLSKTILKVLNEKSDVGKYLAGPDINPNDIARAQIRVVLEDNSLATRTVENIRIEGKRDEFVSKMQEKLQGILEGSNIINKSERYKLKDLEWNFDVVDSADTNIDSKKILKTFSTRNFRHSLGEYK